MDTVTYATENRNMGSKVIPVSGVIGSHLTKASWLLVSGSGSPLGSTVHLYIKLHISLSLAAGNL